MKQNNKADYNEAGGNAMRKMIIFIKEMLLKTFFVVLLLSSSVALPAQFAGGSGTENDPWLISRPEDLARIREYLGEAHSNKHYLQTNDINVRVPPWDEGEGWVPIGTSGNSFFGQYDGDGFVVDSLYINRPEVMWQGLFGDIRDAEISNLGVTNVDIRGQQYSGPLLGYGRGNSRIYNCWSSGEMRGFNTSTGGLIGYIFREITVEECFSLTDVTGNNYIGGLIGMAFRNHNVRNCYARGDVSGNQDIGGFIGLLAQDDSVFENCYSFGRVQGETNVGGLVGRNGGSPLNNCYWNTETSGQQNSAGGSGKTTEQMVYPYADGMGDIYVRWDFEDIWGHDTARIINNGYPYLQFHADLVSPDPPEVTIEIVTIDNVELVRLSWEFVTDALSYNIYASDDPYSDDWGEPAATVGAEVNYHLLPLEQMKYYHVRSSYQEAP